MQPADPIRIQNKVARREGVRPYEAQHQAVYPWAQRLHQVVYQRNPPGPAGVQVADRWVQALRDGRDAHLAFEHRVGIVEHGVHRVGGVAVAASLWRCAMILNLWYVVTSMPPHRMLGSLLFTPQGWPSGE
jgi:hypothetical protein